MDTSKFRGLSPDSLKSGPSCRIGEKDLKKIKVKIVRNVSNPDSTGQVERTLDNPEKLTIIRGKGEGSKPIFERSDVVVNKDCKDTETNVASQRPKSPRKYTSKSDYYSNSSQSRERSPRRESRSGHKETSRRHSPHRSSPRRYSRIRSRSRENQRRSRHRSFSRSPRRSQDRRRSRDCRDYDRRNSRERRYSHSNSRRRSRSGSTARTSHFQSSGLPDPLDPNTLGTIPLLMPPEFHFYGHDDLWLPAPMRPPIMLPRGLLPPRGMFRSPLYRPPPFIPLQPRGPMPHIRGPIIRPRIPRE